MSEEHEVIEPEAAHDPSTLDTLLGSTGSVPWWIISGAFHGLLLMLITLLSIALVRPAAADVIIAIPLEKRVIPEPEKVETFTMNPTDVPFDNKHYTIGHMLAGKCVTYVFDHSPNSSLS